MKMAKSWAAKKLSNFCWNSSRNSKRIIHFFWAWKLFWRLHETQTVQRWWQKCNDLLTYRKSIRTFSWVLTSSDKRIWGKLWTATWISWRKFHRMEDFSFMLAKPTGSIRTQMWTWLMRFWWIRSESVTVIVSISTQCCGQRSRKRTLRLKSVQFQIRCFILCRILGITRHHFTSLKMFQLLWVLHVCVIIQNWWVLF